ncbi:MAG: hypothetical protein ACM3Q4_09590 [Acidobacteriota bacterium]
MRTHTLTFSAAFIMMMALAACDLVDPSKVENPQITQEALDANAVGGATPLVTGLKRYFAIAQSNAALTTDIVSDNYDNRVSYFSSILDTPRELQPNDLTLNTNLLAVPASAANPQDGMYFYLQNLRALADVGLSSVLPNDATTTDVQRGEVHFYRGMALLLLSENFSSFPITEKGAPVSSAEGVQQAIAAFKAAASVTTSAQMKSACHFALARAYRLAKDRANAAAEAQAALALSPSFVFNAEFDAASLANRAYGAAVQRSNNDIQPLPRLDFLDPKYTQPNTPIAVLKAEEAHLILAEAAIVGGDLVAARASMINAITLAKSRATVSFNDKDTRLTRPNDESYAVKSDPLASPKSGLIKKRGGSSVVTTGSISGTSLNASDINAMTTAQQLYAGVYLLRQEIFFFEGRRMSDLGIRLPVNQRQIDGNPLMPAGSPGTRVVVPAYIPAGDGLDQYSVDAASKTVTIAFDLNAIIAANITQASPFLAP